MIPPFGIESCKTSSIRFCKHFRLATVNCQIKKNLFALDFPFSFGYHFFNMFDASKKEPMRLNAPSKIS